MIGLSLAFVLLVSGAATVDREALLNDVRVLSADDMQGRAPGTEGGLKARAYVEKRFREAGVAPLGDRYARPFSFERRGTKIEAANLVGVIRGRSKSDEFIVVTAHYDHLGVRDGQVYNGADDNASGVAAITALGAWFAEHPPERSLLIVALDAEEGGLNGARAFLAEPPVPKAAIKLNVNLDMVSRSPKGELYAAGTHHYPQLKAPLEQVAAAAPIRLLFGHDRPELGKDDWTLQSDHAVFHEAGVPFVYFGVEDHPGYHQPSDDFDAITPDFFVDATRTIIEAVAALDAALL
jgi:Zn-dependent M28 family amino/carboxypeptidase